MEQMISHLMKLGFTELESKCIVVLAENQKMTGYEVAKKLGVSRSNVYAALQTLLDKGMLLSSVGDVTHFHAIPIDEIQGKIQKNMDSSFDFLKQHFPSNVRSLDDFYTIDGEKQVVERITWELHRAEQVILADFWSEEAQLLGDLLLENEKKGVSVLISTVGHVDLPLKTKLIDDREESWQEDGWRKFSFLIDRKVAIIGVRGSNVATKALITEHPALTKLLLNNFFHDVVIHEIMHDMKEELETRYGRNFEEIHRKYTGKGWSGSAN